jgi:hypothetical protein
LNRKGAEAQTGEKQKRKTIKFNSQGARRKEEEGKKLK